MSANVWEFENAPRSRAGQACSKCDRIHSTSDVQHADKFGLRPTELLPYLAFDGTRHATREDAQDWLCRQRATDSGRDGTAT